MYSASSSYRELIDNNTRGQWSASIECNGTTITDDKIKTLSQYQQYMASLSLGNIVSSYVEFELYGTYLAYYDKDITVGVALEEENIPIGIYHVYEKPVITNGTTKVLAYDNVRKLSKKYVSTLAYPATIKDVVNEIMTLCGTTITHITYPNISITEAFDYDTCSQVMSEICKLLGKNLVASRTGGLEYKWFSNTPLNIGTNKHFSLTASSVPTTLGKVACKKGDVELISGTTDEELHMTSKYMTQEQLNSIKDAITITYTVGDITLVGDPTIDVGDIITTADLEGNVFSLPVMQNKFVYDGGCTNYISSYDIDNSRTIVDLAEDVKNTQRVQASASGKNKVYYTQPTGEETYTDGDIWFNANEDNCLYIYINGAWAKRETGTMAISYIDASKITCDDLSAFNATIGGFSITQAEITAYSNDQLNRMVFRPVQANKGLGVFFVGERVSTSDGWSYPTRINGDGSASFSKISIGGNSSLAGWLVTDSIIRKDVTIGKASYQTCIQAADGVSTTNNIYVRHSTDGTNWDYDFSLNYEGKLTTTNIIATGGAIGGWNISQSKIYGGDSSNGVAVMQLPTASNTFIFAAGGTSHSSYADCPFRVTKDGTLYTSKVVADGGSIAGFSISSNGMNYSSSDNLNMVVFRPVQSTKSNGVLYVGTRATTSDGWSYPARINGDGSASFKDITATGGSIGGFTITSSSIYSGGSSFGSSGIYMGTSGISCNAGFKVTSGGICTVKDLRVNQYLYMSALDETSQKKAMFCAYTGNYTLYIGQGFDNTSITNGSFSSTEDIKNNIKELDGKNALSIIKESDVYSYNYKHDLENGHEITRYGFVIGEKYKLSKELLNIGKDGIDMYTSVSINWAATREQQCMLEDTIRRLEILEGKVA